MNGLAQKITANLINRNLLSDDRKDEYVYVIETSLEKLISYAFILTIAVLTGTLVQSIIFLVLFVSIRGRTGGFHMNTYFKCLISTIVLYLLLSVIIIPALVANYVTAYIIFCISILCIILIASVNHPNMDMSKSEFEGAKKASRLNAFIHWSIITTVYFALPQNDYTVYAMSADILCSLLLILAKIKKQTNY